jgi:hypothetical protein
MALAEKVQSMIESPKAVEGKLTMAIEKQTSKVPSVVYFNLAMASIATSLAIAATTKKAEWANFVGHWASAFMLIGIYNKLVKRS